MKNFFRLSVLLIVLLSTAFTSMAQFPQRTPFSDNYNTFSQMWNCNSSTWYFGTVTFSPSGVPNSSNYGRQIDTATGTIKLSTSILRAGKVKTDTAMLQAITGYGYVWLTGSILKVTGSPTVTVTPMQSSDGFSWTQIPGSTVVTITPTSTVTPTITKVAVSPPLDRFYALWYVGDGTNSYSAQAWWYFQRVYSINLQK